MEIYKILHILKRLDGGLSSSCPEPYCHCDKTQLISTEIKQCLSVKQRIKMRNTLSQELGRLRHGQDSNTGIRLWKILIIYDAFGRDVILCIKSINQLLDTAIKVMCRQDQTSCMMQSSWISFRSQLESLQVQSLQKQSVLKLFSHGGRRHRKILWNKISLKKKVNQTPTVLLELCFCDLLISLPF